jgi:hypothetical protein
MSTDVTVIGKQIQKNMSAWQQIHDFRDMKVVKDKGTTYLDKLPGLMTTSEDFYNSYKKRAVISPAVDVAVETNTGMILRKEPVIPDMSPLEYIDENIDKKGTSMKEFINKVTEEVNATQFCGVLVDYSRLDDESQLDNLSVADAKRLGRQAIATFYPALSITNFGLFADGKLRFVTLKETYTKQIEGDNLEEEQCVQYRLLIIRDNVYYNEVYREDKKNKEFMLTEQGIPLKSGVPFESIPFVFFNGLDNTPNIIKPRLKYLSELVNIDYSDSANYKYFLHYSAMATRWATGVTKDDIGGFTEVGPNVMLTAQDPAAKFGMLEFSPAVPSALVVNLNNNKELIASQVLNSLGVDIKGEQTATAASYQQTGKTVSLRTIASSIETGINKVVELIFDWEGVPYDKNTRWIEINKNFDIVEADAQVLQALLASLMSGKITQETYFNNLKKMELIKDTETYEEYQDNLDNMAPANPNMNEEV